jgi:hypothetical protein
MKTFTLDSGSTWRKLGYLLYGSSLEYRKVLKDNPKWSVDYLPPSGSVLFFSGSGNSGVTSSGVSQVIGSKVQESWFFPFSSEAAYLEELSKYAPGSLMSVEENNGWTLDSVQAVTGLQ